MKVLILILLVMTLNGCGLVPAYIRSQPDSLKVSNMMLYGGSKRMVKSDFGEPDSILTEDNIEIWTYHNREDGRSIEFYFDERGKIIRTYWGDKSK